MRLKLRIFLACADSSRLDQSETWLVIDPPKAFSSIVCESLRNNEIDLLLPTAQLVLVTKYLASSLFCAIRLTKRGGEMAVIRFEFNFADSGNSLVVHDVPAELGKGGWSEPLLPDPTATAVLDRGWPGCHIDRLAAMGVSQVRLCIGSALGLTAEGGGVSLTMGATDGGDNHVTVSLKGLSFVLNRLPARVSCLAALCPAKYFSVWLQFPMGALVAVTPGIMDL